MSEEIILVDVGSANGVYPPFNKIKNAYKNIIIFTFDPEKTGFENNLCKHNINFNIGLFNQEITLPLYITNKNECSSLFQPNMDVINNYYNPNRFVINKMIPIKLKRLDNVIDKSHIDIIKLDTQGSEYEILEGCGNLIKNTKIIVSEVEFVELYKKQKLFLDLANFLKKKDFILLKFLRLVYFSKEKSYLIDMDIEEKTLLLCKKLNLIQISDLFKLKFNLINLLLTNNENNIQNYHSLILIEKEIKSLIPSNIKNKHELLLNSDLIFGDAIFINKNTNYQQFLKYLD